MLPESYLHKAQRLDAEDTLAKFRDAFHIPLHEGKPMIYFTGNSLGLAPKTAAAALQQELDDWARWGVEGHFHATNPWFSYHEWFSDALAPLVGAKPLEVVAMNQLTVNIHLLLASFYKPDQQRYKIICEAKAFPSDQYALQTHIQWHGLDPKEVLIEIAPKDGKHTIDTAQLIEAIETAGDTLALVFIGGVNYYTGQVFDMPNITAAAHKAGAKAGFDLAHAVGNISLQLHEWNVDFACWCSYKYLNSGPGSVSGIFIHERHATNTGQHRLAGWWAQQKDVRFLMEPEFKPTPTAEGWQMSNAPVFSMAAHRAALKIFHEAGIENVFDKGGQLAAFTKEIIQAVNEALPNAPIEMITPMLMAESGCQVSLRFHHSGKAVFDALTAKGVMVDWREPDVIRLAPVPLYNRFEEIVHFGNIILEILQ